MTQYLRNPLSYTWLFLVTATVLGFWLHQYASVLATLVIFGLALFKCRLVIWNYMEVRLAPRWLRWTCDAWLVLNLAMVSSFYWLVL